jgi:hypothetical protein
MTLVSSGTIRMSDINVELGRSSTANISLDTAENGGYGAINTNSTSRPSSNNPAAISEWYSYNHNAAPSISYSYVGFYYYEDPCSGGTAVYYGSNGRWYRSGDGLNFTDITGGFGTIAGNEDPPFYIYFLYNFQINNPSPVYFGDQYSGCAPF